MDVNKFAPASGIDPEYAKALKKAYKAGVEIIPVQAEVSPEKTEIVRELPFEFLVLLQKPGKLFYKFQPL